MLLGDGQRTLVFDGVGNVNTGVPEPAIRIASGLAATMRVAIVEKSESACLMPERSTKVMPRFCVCSTNSLSKST